MPLKAGKSLKTMRGNVAEILHSFKRKGTIGTSRPKSMRAAQKQATAIAAKKAGRRRRRGRRKCKSEG